MSRGTRIRGVVRVSARGTARDNAVSPNEVQEAINRHFTLLGDAASEYGGTVEHLSGAERLFLFLDAPKTLAAAGALQSAAVRISAMKNDTEPTLIFQFAADCGSTSVDERLQKGQVRTFTVGEAAENVAAMIDGVPSGQLWVTQSLVDEAAKFGHQVKVQAVQPVTTASGRSVPVVQISSFLSGVAASIGNHSVRAAREDTKSAQGLLKVTLRLAVIAAILIGAYAWWQANPKTVAKWKAQIDGWTKSMNKTKAPVKKAAAPTADKPKAATKPAGKPKSESIDASIPAVENDVAPAPKKNRLEKEVVVPDEIDETPPSTDEGVDAEKEGEPEPRLDPSEPPPG